LFPSIFFLKMVATFNAVVFIAFIHSFGQLLLCHDLVEWFLEEVVDLEKLSVVLLYLADVCLDVEIKFFQLIIYIALVKCCFDLEQVIADLLFLFLAEFVEDQTFLLLHLHLLCGRVFNWFLAPIACLMVLLRLLGVCSCGTKVVFLFSGGMLHKFELMAAVIPFVSTVHWLFTTFVLLEDVIVGSLQLFACDYFAVCSRFVSLLAGGDAQLVPVMEDGLHLIITVI